MAGKYWWEEYEKQGEEKSSGESENTYWWNDGSVEKAIGNDVTKRVNSWLDHNNSYLSSYNKRYESRKFTHEDAYVSDSASWLDTVKKQADDLETERQELITYINQNKRYLDPEWVKSVEEYLAGESTKHKGIVQRATQDNDYWKKFTPNEEQTAAGYTAAKLYSEWQASTQQHIDDLAFDVDAGNTQLAQLKADRESYLAQKEAERKEKLENETFWEQLGRYLAGSYDTSIPLAGASTYVSDSGTRITTPYDREIAELEERIQRANDVQQYENQYAFFDAYTKMPDFDSKSAYKSTYRGGEELNAWSGTYTDTGFDDITYDYINRNEMAMDRMLVNNIATNASFLGLDESYLKEMTDDEIKIYNYLYEPGHTDAADQYIEFLLSDLTYRQRKRQQEEWAAYAQEHPFLASGFSIMTSPLKGLSALGQVADYASDGTIDQNAGYNKFSYIPTAIRTQVASEIEKSGKWGKVGSWTYQLGMSIGDFLMTTAVSGGNSTISLALMGSGAMADTVISAKDRGLSDDQAMILGVVAGGAEIITEKFSLDALFKGGLEKGALKYILTNAFTEGTEEVSSSLINLFADIIVSKDQSQWQMQINDYIAEHPGATEGEAFRNVLTDTAISLGLDFLGGTLSGAAMGGGGATINYFTEAAPYLQKNKDAVNKYGNQTDALIQEGLESDKDSTSYYLAQKYQQQVQGKDGKNGKALTGYQIRNLLEANQEQITPKDMQKIQKAAENRLMALGQTEDVQYIAELATKRATGQKLTRAEKSDLANSQYGSRVANEMLPKNVLSGGYTSEWAEDIGTKQVNFAAYNKKALVRELVEAMSEDPTAYKSLENRTKGETPAQVSSTGKAVIRATNEEIDLSDPKIKSITEDSVVLDVNGKDVEISEIDFENEDQWNMFNALKKIEHITPAAASSMIAKLDTSKPIWGQLNGMDEAFTYGYYNYSEADLKAGLFTGNLTKEQLNDAYKLGQYVAEKSQADKAERYKAMRTAAQAEAEKAEAEGKGKPQPKNLTISYNMGGGKVVSIEEAGITDPKRSGAVEVAKILHKLGLGTRIEFFTSEESDTLTVTDKYGKVKKARVFINDAGVEQIAYSGVYRKSDGTIRVDLNAYNGRGLTMYALAHELTHFIQQWSDKKYKVLVDFLMKTYESTDMTMHQRVLAHQKFLKENGGREVSYDEAYDEVVANAMMKMFDDGKLVERLTELKAVDKNLAQKLWEGFKNILNKFLHLYEKEGALWKDTDDIMKMKEAFEQLQNMFAEALVEASENYQASLTPGVEGTVVSKTGEAVAHCTEDGTVQLSLHTYETEGRDVFRDYLEKCVSSKKLTKAEMTEMLDGIEEIYQTCKEFKDKYAPFSTWSDAAVVRDTHGKPVFSVVTPNGDYKMNLDFSLVCKKRRTLDAVFNEMSKRGIIDDFELGQKSVVKINEIIRKYGLETACALCFVDAKRFRQASMADSFTRLYNELVESLVPEDQKSSIGHFNFSGYETIKQVENAIDTWDNSKLDFSHINHVLKTYSNKSVEYKTAKYIKTHAEGRKLLLRGDFMSSKGFDAVKTQNPDVLKLYNSKKGTGGPKAAFGDVQYMNEVIQKARWWTPEKAFSVGGIRVQSFSDYVPRMVFDYVQMIYDLAATKLPAHAYTKEALFVKQFGLTGIKINMSLIPAIAEGGIAPGLDANGNYVWAGESFDYDTAKEIQNAEGYTENCGTICVGVSKEHILKLLRDPNIRMVIPYHKSGLNPIVAHMNKIAEFHDYTNDQRTKGKDGKALDKDFDFSKALHDMGENANPKAVADQYLKWCAAHGYTPRFAEFAMEENYYKLLEDFTLYDKDGNYVPQRAVKATFPTESSAFGSMKSLIEAGLQEDAVIEGKRDKSLSAIVDEIQENLPKTEAEIEETQVEQADHDLEQYSSQETDADYMDAVKHNDMDTAQKLADAVAKRAGFPVKVFHGTKQFGFTKANVKKSDDGMSFFATEDIVVAGSYSGVTVAEERKISDSNQKLARKDVPKLSNQIKDIATEFVNGYTNALGHQSWYMVAVDSITDQDLYDVKSPKDLMDYATTAIDTISSVHLNTMDGEPGKHKGTITEETKQKLTKLTEEYTQKLSSLIAPYSESGVYGLYANTDNFLVIDAQGSYWNKIKSDALPARDEAWTTRDVAQYAKKNGYSGVKFENLIDPANGTAHKPATVYAFFNPESQLKSADPVTYDNFGRPIPLSKRFNTKKGDFRYSSQETDADTDGFKDYDIVSAVYTIRNEKAKRGHDLVEIGNMPKLYSDLFGLSGVVYVSNEHLYQNMVSRATAEAEGRFNSDDSADYHELGEEKVINAIEQFQDPIAIMESLKDFKEPRLVAILDEKGNDGDNLIAVLELYSKERAYGSPKDRSHVLITIYEKNSLPDYIEKTVDKNRILHIKGGPQQIRQAGLQLSGDISEKTLKKNVAQFNKKVKAFKEKNGIQYSSQETDADNAPTFYSQMGKVVDGMKQEKFGASSVISMLRGRGVKSEEIRWSGIQAFLDGKKSVTKQELLDFIKGSMLHIEEEALGGVDKQQLWDDFYGHMKDVIPYFSTEELEEMCFDYDGEFSAIKFKAELLEYVEEGVISEYDYEDATEYAEEMEEGLNSSETKWSKYKLDGGSNYRELLFRMPGATYSNNAMKNHWGEDAKGVLAHARIQDLDTFIGNMLFIEEIQSDWHNQGGKVGYGADMSEEEKKAALEKVRVDFMSSEVGKSIIKKVMQHESENGTKFANEQAAYDWIELDPTNIGAEYVALYTNWATPERIQAFLDLDEKISKLNQHRVPEAPFKNNYHEYVLKRLLRMAAEEGYDSIGWTTADIQSERWSEDYSEGYRIEYDQDIPKFLKKYGKQWGAEVGKTTLDNGTEVWSMSITDAMKNSVLTEGQAMYSGHETDYSNRSLLANAFESITKSSEEYKLIQEYKGYIAELNSLENKLSDFNRQIREIRFTEGKYDAEKLKGLESEAKKIADAINKYDQYLLSLEASGPLRKLIEQERKKEALKTIDHVKDIMQNKKLRAEQTELRHKIRKAVRDLDKILNRGNKKQNVKEDMKGFVSKALELADYLFTDHISNDELIRRGITVRMTPREAALVKETEEIIAKLDANTDINKQDSSLTDEEFTRLDEKRKANEDKLRDLLTAQRNERLQTPVYNLFSDLVTEYASLSNSNQEAVKAAYDPKVDQFLRSYIGEVNGQTDTERKTLLQNMRIADMTTDELWKLYNAYTMVLHSVRKANEFFVKGMTETIEQKVGRIAGDFSSRKIPEKKLAIALQKIGNKIGWNYEKLHYALDRIGSEAFTELVMNIANSENIVMQDVQEAKAFLDEIVKEYKFNKWAVNKEIDREFLDNTGKKFKMTLGQLMSLYAYSRRDGAWDHIEYGGFVFGEKALTNPRPADSYKLSKKQVEAITSLLTKEQKAYVEAMQKYLSETMGEKGNEVSMQLYGIKMFGEKNYFPIHIAGQYKAQAQESQAKAAAGFGSMSNAGFTHAQNPNAKAPFVLEGFNEIWVDHVNEMSRYHGTVPALEDMRRVMNRSSYSESGMESMAIKQLMENAFGEEAVNYFDNLYREANSGAITDKLQSKSHKLLSLFRKNSVAYSLSVLIQQPGSIVRAYALVDRKYFGFKGVGAITSGVAKAVTSKWNKAYVTAYNEMMKYAPGVTLAKEIGGFDTHTGGSIRSYLLDTDKSFGQKWQTGTALEKGKAVMDLVDDNAIANLPNVADKIAWIEIWNACKRETVAKHKDLVPNSEEFMKVVGDRFTEVIRATQVYDSMFSKSPMLKSKNLAVQYLVSFMNEPNTTANMVEKALRDVTKGDWKSGLRTAHVVIHSIIFTNLLKSLIYAMRDDDEDETYIEKYIEAVTGNMMDDFNPLNYIPLARDAWSIAQGYDVERADMAIVADALDSLDRVLKNAFTDTDEMTEEELVEFDKKVTEANWKLVESMASFFGVPVKNIRREVNGFIDHAKIASANAGKTTKMSLDDTFYDAIIDSIPFMSSKNDKQDKLYEAIISGDTKYADRMKSTYKTDDAYHAAIRKALRENDSRIKEAAQARYAGNTDEYKRIFREIQSEGNFVFDDIMSAINSELSKLTPDKETSDYTATGYVEALIMGNTVNADAMKENIISTKVANGKTQSAAEKEFATNVATGIGNAYSSGLLSKAEAEKMLAKYAGMDDEDAASRADYWAFCEKYPKYKDVFTESHVAKYYEFAESANISVEMYAKFIEGTKGLATIRDKWGDVEVTKREQVLDVIDSLPLTWKQKDALYLAYGYSENEIMNVPW